MNIKKHTVLALVALPLALSAMTGMPMPTGPRADEPSDSTPAAPAAPVETPVPEHAIVDEVVWVVGDEPILKSDIEMMRMQGQMEGITFGGNPDCTIPEQLAVQKLFLHQAAIDSIEVTEAEISSGVDMQIQRWIEIAGGQEKLEE